MFKQLHQWADGTSGSNFDLIDMGKRVNKCVKLGQCGVEEDAIAWAQGNAIQQPCKREYTDVN